MTVGEPYFEDPNAVMKMNMVMTGEFFDED